MTTRRDFLRAVALGLPLLPYSSSDAAPNPKLYQAFEEDLEQLLGEILPLSSPDLDDIIPSGTSYVTGKGPLFTIRKKNGNRTEGIVTVSREDGNYQAASAESVMENERYLPCVYAEGNLSTVRELLPFIVRWQELSHARNYPTEHNASIFRRYNEVASKLGNLTQVEGLYLTARALFVVEDYKEK